jgi:hypothetical protein
MESQNNKHVNCYVLAILAATLVLPLSPSSRAATVPWDLLGGVGEFEYPARQIVAEANTGNRIIDWPQRGCSIACGWFAMVRYLASASVGNNVKFDIVPGCKHASNGQSISVGNMTSSNFAAVITNFAVSKTGNNYSRRTLQPGDVITFTLDHVKMSDYENAPVTFKMRLKWDHPTQHYGIYTDKVLNPSSSPFSSSVTVAVPFTDNVQACVWVEVHGDLGKRRPTIIFDGAHLTVQRKGKVVTEEVPVTAKRAIRTIYTRWNPNNEDVAAAAARADELVLACEDYYKFVPKLRYYNPNIRIYLYQAAGTISDSRAVDSSGNQYDVTFSNCPLGFLYVLQNHEEWLYCDPYNPKPKYDINSPPFVRDPNFPYLYYAKVSDPHYQDAWVENALLRLKTYNVDGIFMDTLEAVESIGRTLEDVQSFIRGVCPRLREAGYKIIQNAACVNLSSRAGQLYFDPNWRASKEKSAVSTSSDNAPDLTADALFNEFAYFYSSPKRVNVFSYPAYWLRCIQDQVTVANWNSTLPEELQKHIYSRTLGWDLASDAAAGVDGWGNFALCSYLLGQNEWTAFNCDERESKWQPDFSKTLLIGTPSGPDLPVVPANPYCRYRVYVGNDQGAKGGVVVVNGGNEPQAITLPFDLVDETGKVLVAGNTAMLKPHTGRLFYHQNGYKYVSVITSPRENEVVQGPNFKITGRVVPNRLGLAMPKLVQVKIDYGSWINCPVDAQGNWSLDRTLTYGRHTIYSRVYVGYNDSEPIKAPRTFTFQNRYSVRRQ